MSVSTESNDETASAGVVERLDRARERVKDAARKAQDRLAPTLERASETAESAKRQVQAAGQEAVAQVRRRPWLTGLAVAGLGIGAFLLVKSSARARLFSTAQTLWNRHGSRLDLASLASKVDTGDLRSRLDPSKLAEQLNIDSLRDRLDDLAALGDRIRHEAQRRLAA